MPTHNTIFEGTVSVLAFGGMGIVRQENLVVFIPFTAPGDHIQYRITSRKKKYAFGELVSVLSPSELRVVPLCPYFGTCGGCQLQHITYQTQIEYKRQSVKDALERIGHLPVDQPITIVPAQQIWGYRRHISLNLRSQDDRFQLGYIAVDGHSLLPVECCPIFVPFEIDIIKQLRILVQRLKPYPGSSGRVSILKNNEDGYILNFHFDQIPINMEEVITQAIHDKGCWKGAAVHSQLYPSQLEKSNLDHAKAPGLVDRKSAHIANIDRFTIDQPRELSQGSKSIFQAGWGIYGEVCTEYTIDNLRFEVSPEAFIQNNAEQSLNIYMELCRMVAQTPGKVLDLYCGIGISSLLLAKRGCQVCGIEGNGVAIELAKSNAIRNKLSNVNFLCGDVRKSLSGVLQRHHFDCIILNPPRTGTEPQVIQNIIKHRPRKIFYISCMPSTLARDLSPLCHAGYGLTDAIAFDMFPQTAHVETLVQLTLS